MLVRATVVSRGVRIGVWRVTGGVKAYVVISRDVNGRLTRECVGVIVRVIVGVILANARPSTLHVERRRVLLVRLEWVGVARMLTDLFMVVQAVMVGMVLLLQVVWVRRWRS